MAIRRWRARAARAMVTTNAWCAIPKAIAWRSWRSENRAGVVPARRGPQRGRERRRAGKRVARSHADGETLDALVVARQRRHNRRTYAAARGLRRGRHRWGRDHAYLWRAWRGVAADRIPVAALGGDADAYHSRSPAAGAGHRHGHRHGLALRRPMGECC